MRWRGAITARPLIVAFASLRRFAPFGNARRRRGCSSATATSRTCARCLRTRVPVTKPPILGITGGMLEALLSVLQRPPMDGVSLCCSHHGSESGQGRYRHHKLAHCSLPLSIYGDATILGCIKSTSTSYCYDMLMSTVQIHQKRTGLAAGAKPPRAGTGALFAPRRRLK
jgi:hypothetical protein